MNISTVISIIAVLLTVQGLTFTIFWRIIEAAKKSAHKRIDELHMDIEKQRELLSNKADREPMYHYMDTTFVRKDVHATEYKVVIEKLDELKRLFAKITK